MSSPCFLKMAKDYKEKLKEKKTKHSPYNVNDMLDDKIA